MKLYLLIVAVVAIGVNCNPDSDQKLSRHGRIYGGRDVQANEQHEYKHQVKLSMTRLNGTFSCSGSIITQFAVVTAAHCLENTLSLDVTFGMRVSVIYDIKDLETLQTQTVNPAAFRIHPNYTRQSLKHDIALVILPNPIRMSNIVNPIQMALPSDKCYGYAGKRVVVSGWGRMNDRGDSPVILQTTIITIANSDDCTKIFGTDKEKTICSSSSAGTGVCHGDSGGPVVLDVNGTPTLIGVSSFIQGPECVKAVPTVSTCIAAYIDWIQKNLK